jgi:MFS family permease
VMRLSGRVTDRVGPRKVVPAGIILMAVATVPFAFVSAGTSEILLAGTLFLRGIGLGLSMMPIMAAAYFDLVPAQIPRASTTLNIMRQIGGSVAVAAFAVVLQRQIIERTTRPGQSSNAGLSLDSTVKLPPEIASKVSAAFAHTFWWAVITILIAFVPTMFLPNKSAKDAAADSAPKSGDGNDEDPSPAPVLLVD